MILSCEKKLFYKNIYIFVIFYLVIVIFYFNSVCLFTEIYYKSEVI